MAIIATGNKVRYEEFELQIKQSDQASPQNHECYVFEWLDNGHGKGNMSRLKVPELEQRPPCPLRIVLAPLDYPNNEIGHDILTLYKHYSIPGAFVSERLRNVACSFGTTYGQDGVKYCWFHFLCKNVPIEDRNGVKEIVNQNHSEDYEETIISNADFSWWRSAYCLITKPEGPNQEPSEVTLLSFGPELLLLNRLKDISKRASGQEILKDPYSLFNVVFEVLYERMDILTWNIADVFSYYEMASTPHPETLNLPSAQADESC
ncbi:hypothetical protein N7490_003215 [Penicillium lividum]|nr:hypothetical protein N7490_003215 [Penicillium lividum]